MRIWRNFEGARSPANCCQLNGGCCALVGLGAHARPSAGNLSGPTSPIDAPNGSVSFRAVEFDKFRPSTPGLKLSRGQRGQSRFSAYATSAALRREHVGAYGIGIVESFAVRHSRDSSVPLIQCSSVHASVDIDP
jgi:hypothetical protein